MTFWCKPISLLCKCHHFNKSSK